MTMFDDLGARNLYLCDQLITARKQNEVLTEHIATLVQDLKDSSDLLDAFVKYLS